MNMSNTTPADIEATEYAKVTEHTSWQELVPFLRTGDIVTVHTTSMIELGGPVWRDAESLCVTAGSRIIRHADGTFNSTVTDVFLRRAFGRADDLEPITVSLKAGDVVRATFVFVESPVITLEGTVETDRDGDVLLATEGEDGDLPGHCHLTFRGLVWPNLRALEVLSHVEDDAPLTFGAYAARAAETAVYPGAGTFWGLQYVTAGIASEAGEVLGKVSKMQRDGGYTPESSTYWGGDRADLVAELGDVAWYLAMACIEVDIDPDEVLTRNLSKLADRAARDTIQGSGDNR